MKNYCNYLKSKKYATNSDFTFKEFLKLKKFLLIFFLNILLNSCCIPDLRPCDGYNFFPSKSYDFLIKADDFLKVENDLEFKFYVSLYQDPGGIRPPLPRCSSGCNTALFSSYYTKNGALSTENIKSTYKIKKIFILNRSNKFIIEKEIDFKYFGKGDFSEDYLPYEIEGDAVMEIEVEKGVFKYIKQRNRKDYLKEYYQKSN